MGKARGSRLLPYLIAAGLVAVTVAAYWGVTGCGFVNLDDNLYVTGNPNVRDGLTMRGIAWAFTSFHASNWHPLTWLSHMLDATLYGQGPLGPHVTNLILHVLSTLILFSVTARMTTPLSSPLPKGGMRGVWRGAIIAALFAVHPVHVESVAWVAERKDVLSTLFWLLTMPAYARYTQQPSARRYALVLTAFAIGLTAKPMLVSLPIVLILLDYWPLSRTMLRGIVLEKAPLFALAAASCLVTILAQKGGAMSGLDRIPLPLRIDNALVSYVAYIWKTVWPRGLAVIYPHPVDRLPEWQVAMSAIVLVVVSYVAVRAAKTRPYLAVGWFWYLITLAPVIGLVQVGVQGMADRYTYVPLIGLFVAVVWGLGDLIERAPAAKAVARIVAVCVIVGLAVCTWFQVGHWRGSVSLLEHTLACTSGNYLAHNNFGCALLQKGKRNEALRHFRKAMRISPLYPDAHVNLGAVLASQGKLDDALTQFRVALDSDSDNAHALLGLGRVLLVRGRLDEARVHLTRSIESDPNIAEAHSCLGTIASTQGKCRSAVEHYSEALRVDPAHADAHWRIALELEKLGRTADAVDHYRAALRIEPSRADAANNLAWVLATCPDSTIRAPAEAVRIARRACKATRFRDPALLDTLAAAHAAAGRFEEAVETQRKVVGLSSKGAAREALDRLRLYQSEQAFVEKHD